MDPSFGSAGAAFVPQPLKAVAAEARAWGIQAQAVHGNLPTGTRERRIADFLGGKILLLVTVGLLTEGFDAPDAVVCILARPYTVVSIRVLLPQSIGRVVRATPGKPTPIVIELVDEDSTGRRRGVADYFGSSPEPAEPGAGGRARGRAHGPAAVGRAGRDALPQV